MIPVWSSFIGTGCVMVAVAAWLNASHISPVESGMNRFDGDEVYNALKPPKDWILHYIKT